MYPAGSLRKISSTSLLFLVIPIALSAFTHLWNPIGFPFVHGDEGHYLRRASLDRTTDQTNHKTTATRGEEERNGEEGIVQQMQNQADRVHDNRDKIPQQVQEKAPTNANSSNSP
jgi:hypothetical protein